jgi:hypothetical protein
VNESDPLHLRRLLRSGREWPRSRRTKCRDEIAPSHLTRPRRCSAHCPNYSNLEPPARDKWHLPVQDAGNKSALCLVGLPGRDARLSKPGLQALLASLEVICPVRLFLGLSSLISDFPKNISVPTSPNQI